MEVAIKNSYHVKRDILCKLNNRECIVRVSDNGVVLSPFKARTIDFEPIHKQVVNQILDVDKILLKPQEETYNVTEKITDNKVYKFSIDIDNNTSLFDLMKSQSEGRKMEVPSHG